MKRLEELHHTRPYYFQPTLRLGDFVTILVVLGGLWHWSGDVLSQIAALTTRQADIVSRIDEVEKRLDRLTRAAENIPIADPGLKGGAARGSAE